MFVDLNNLYCSKMWINYSNSFTRKIQNTEIYMDLSDLLRSKVFEKNILQLFAELEMIKNIRKDL